MVVEFAYHCKRKLQVFIFVREAQTQRKCICSRELIFDTLLVACRGKGE